MVQKISLENNSWENVIGVGSCQLKLCSRHMLIIYGVLYVLDVQHILLSTQYFTSSLLGLGFTFTFSGNKLNICSGANLFIHTIMSSGFIKLDLDHSISPFSYIALEYFNLLNVTIELDILGKERMNRLDKEGILGPIDKVSLLFVSPAWQGSA